MLQQNNSPCQYRKYNILVLHQAADWYGSDKVIHSVVETLAAHASCQVVLPYSGLLNSKIGELGIPCQVIKFPVFRKKYLKPLGLIALLAQFILSAFALGSIIIRKKIDIIYSNTFCVFSGAILAKLFGKKHIWHIHEILVKPAIFKRTMHRMAKSLSDLNICVSHAVASNIGEHHSIRVIHNGIKPVLEKPVFERKQADIFQVSVVGRFNAGKGQLHAIKAVETIMRNHPECKEELKLLLVGSYFQNNSQWYEEVIKYISDNCLNKTVVVKGYTENIGDLFANMDLCLLPSIAPDSFPTIVLEAMSAGVPVVAYDCGGVREMLQGDPDCLIAQGDLERLSERIFHYSTHENERIAKAKMQNEIYKKAFSMEAFRNRYMHVFKSFCSNAEKA